MESDEDNGKDSISDLVNEVVGEVVGELTGPAGEGPEEDGDNLAGEAKRRWKRSWILSGGAITFILSVLMFLLLPADNKERVVDLAPKAEEAAVIKFSENDDGPLERIDYELEPFFIPIEGGKRFLRLRMSLIEFMDGMDRKIKMSPHKYRAAVLNIFSGKKVREIEGRRGRKMVKDEIESKFKIIGGDEMMGKIVFTSYALTK